MKLGRESVTERIVEEGRKQRTRNLSPSSQILDYWGTQADVLQRNSAQQQSQHWRGIEWHRPSAPEPALLACVLVTKCFLVQGLLRDPNDGGSRLSNLDA